MLGHIKPQYLVTQHKRFEVYFLLEKYPKGNGCWSVDSAPLCTGRQVSSMLLVCHLSRTLKSSQLAEGRRRIEKVNPHLKYLVLQVAYSHFTCILLGRTGHIRLHGWCNVVILARQWKFPESELQCCAGSEGPTVPVLVRVGTCLSWVGSSLLSMWASEPRRKGTSDIIWLSPHLPIDGKTEA